MAEIHEINGAFTVSISTIAREFGMDRATVARRFSDSGIKPNDKVNGYPVYRLRDAVKAILCIPIDSDGANGNGDFDPTKLPPTERRAWMQSENDYLKMLKEKKQLIPAEVHEKEMTDMVKIVVQLLASLPDRLERECSLGIEVVERVVTACDQLRAEFHAEMVK